MPEEQEDRVKTELELELEDEIAIFINTNSFAPDAAEEIVDWLREAYGFVPTTKKKELKFI